MKMNRMHTANRILALLLIALMVLSLAACGTKGDETKAERQHEQRTEERRGSSCHAQGADGTGKRAFSRRTQRFGKRFSWRPTRA